MKLYTVEEACKILKLSRQTLWKLSKKGLINCYRMKSGQIRFSEAHIMELLGGGK